MDRRGLRRVFVDGQLYTAVLEFAVGDHGLGGGQKQHDRPVDPHLFGADAAVIAFHRAGEDQGAVRLQQLQGIRGILGPLLLGYRQDLVPKAVLAQVIERFRRNRAVAPGILIRHHAHDRIHQHGLPGRGRGLDQHGQGRVHLSRGSSQVRRELVHPFAHQPAGVEIRRDPVDQVRRAQKFQGRGALLGGHPFHRIRRQRFRRFPFGHKPRLDALFCEQEQLLHVAGDQRRLHRHFARSGRGEGRALPVVRQVEAILVAILRIVAHHHPQADLDRHQRGRALQPEDTPRAVADHNMQRVTAHLHRVEAGHRRGRRRHACGHRRVRGGG